MKRKLILTIDESVTDEEALQATLAVVAQGKISKTSLGKQYCFHSVTVMCVEVTVVKHKSGTETFYIRTATT